MELTLKEQARKVIEEDAVSSYPYECCGFMYGSDEGKRIVTYAEPVQNTKTENKERRFEISPLAYIKAEEYADNNNLTLLGVYHSHPDHPAIPSEHDLKQALPYFSYIIASVKKGKIADVFSWRLSDKGRFEQEKVNLQKEFDLNDLLTN